MLNLGKLGKWKFSDISSPAYQHTMFPSRLSDMTGGDPEAMITGTDIDSPYWELNKMADILQTFSNVLYFDSNFTVVCSLGKCTYWWYVICLVLGNGLSPSHYLNQCWPRFKTYGLQWVCDTYGLQWVNKLMSFTVTKHVKPVNHACQWYQI